MNLTEFRLYKGQPGVGEGPGRTSRLGALGCIQRRGPGSAGFPTTRGVGPAAWSPGFLADGESLLKPAGMRLPSPLLLQGRISFRQIRGVDLGVPCRLAPSPPSAAVVGTLCAPALPRSRSWVISTRHLCPVPSGSSGTLSITPSSRWYLLLCLPPSNLNILHLSPW